MYKSIKRRAAIFISIIIISSFLSLGIYNYNISKKIIHDEITLSSLPLLRENIYSEIKRNFIPALGVAAVMSKDSFLISWIINNENDTDKITRYLNKIKTEFSYETAFFVSEKSKKYYHHDGILKNINKKNSHDDWYYKFVNTGLEYELDVDFDEAHNNDLTIFINHRVIGFNNEFLGVAGIGIRMENFSKFLSDQQEKFNRNIYLVDSNGVIQAHSNIDNVEKVSIYQTEGIKDIAKKLLNNDKNTYILSYSTNNHNIIASSKYIKDINWFLIVEQDETIALNEVQNNFIRTIIVGFLVLVIILFLIIFILNFFSRKLEILAITDPLTNCYNRREFNLQLERFMDKLIRNGSHITLISIDIDHFKLVNDTLGHQYGDLVLKKVSALINENKRPNDILFRLGGDEFSILLEGNLSDGKEVAKRIQKQLANTPIHKNKNRQMTITLSIGIYQALRDDTTEKIINNSDKALYKAKESGRNRIEF